MLYSLDGALYNQRKKLNSLNVVLAATRHAEIRRNQDAKVQTKMELILCCFCYCLSVLRTASIGTPKNPGLLLCSFVFNL